MPVSRTVYPSAGKISAETLESIGEKFPEALISTRGGRYKPDSPVLHRAQGRTAFNASAPSSGFSSIFAADFNSQTDQLLMFQGTGVFAAPIPLTPAGPFVAVQEQRQSESGTGTSFAVSAQTMPILGAKFADAFLIADGVSRPTLYENNLRARTLGLIPANGPLTFSDPTPGAFVRPNAVTTAFTGTGALANSARIYDSDQNTSGTFTVTGGGSAQAVLSFAAGAGASRFLRVTYSGSQSDPSLGTYEYQIEVSTDSGTTYTNIIRGSPAISRITSVAGVAGTPALDTIRVRLTLRASLGNAVNVNASSSWDAFDVVLALQAGGTGTPVSTTGSGIRYAYTKLRKYQRIIPGQTDPYTFEVESSLSPLSPPISAAALTFTNWSGVKITRTEVFESEVTHWRVYRSIDGASNADTLALDQFSKVLEAPASETILIDMLTEGGFPLNYQDPATVPPILVIGDLLINANDPPPGLCDVVGAYQGSALYAAASSPGRFSWSRPQNPDYVPAIYADLVSGPVTAFADVGVLLVFTPQKVYAYSVLPIALDADFTPGRYQREISSSRGCVSRRGVALFQQSGGETLAAFVAGDGLYVTNGAQVSLLSPMLDWPSEISVASLSSSILKHNPAERCLHLIYPDAAGLTQCLDFCYNRERFAPFSISVVGPRRFPSSSASEILQSTGVFSLFSEQAGLVYLEGSGTIDGARLEDSLGSITFAVQVPQIYPFGPDQKGDINSILLRTPAAIGATMTVTGYVRIDTQGTLTEPAVSIPLDTPGWKEFTLRQARGCESVSFLVETSSQNFPGLDAWALNIGTGSKITAARLTQ